MEKLCLECKRRLIGRSDKKFCEDLCRNAYHNRENSIENQNIRKVNARLRKNRRILAKISLKKTEDIERDQLLMMGFNFNFFTQQVIQEGQTCVFSYDFGYMEKSSGKFDIICQSEIELNQH